MKKFTTFLFPIFAAVAAPLVAQDGALDATFATAGVASFQFSGFSSDGYAIGRQTDGKIVVAGVSQGGGTNIAVARYNTNGTPDATFGTAGLIAHPWGSSTNVTCLTIQSDGKILIGGASAAGTVTGAMIARLAANGSLDATFGTNGIAEFTDQFSQVVDLRVTAGGKIVGLGKANDASPKAVFGVFRRTANGSKDATFGTNGYFFADMGNNVTPTKMALQADGKILMTGTTYNATSKYDMVLGRVTTAGAFDATFGTAGKTISSFAGGSIYEQGNDIVVQSDGKIVVAGRNGNVGGGNNAFMICRYTAAGVLDNTYGTGGFSTLSNANLDEFKAAAIMGDGRVIAVGSTRSTATGQVQKLAISRWTTAGKLDNTFGTNGTSYSIVATGASCEDVVLQPDGKIIVGGWSKGSNSLHSFLLARFNNTGTSGVQVLDAQAFGASVFPNPVSGGVATLALNLPESETLTARLFNLEGRLVETFFSKKMTAGEQAEALNFPAGLPVGMYVLRLETERGVAAISVVVN